MDPDAFTPVPHFTSQGIFKAKPLDQLRMIKGIEFPSLKTIVSSSFGMNQQFLSTKTGASSMLNVKIAEGSMYTVLFGLLRLQDPSGKTLSEVGAACALPPASALSSASASSAPLPRVSALLSALELPPAPPAPELTAASASSIMSLPLHRLRPRRQLIGPRLLLLSVLMYSAK